MNNYETADTIRDCQKKSLRYSKISTTLWILSALGITVASGFKVATVMCDCKSKHLFDEMKI